MLSRFRDYFLPSAFCLLRVSVPPEVQIPPTPHSAYVLCTPKNESIEKSTAEKGPWSRTNVCFNNGNVYGNKH